MGHSATVPSLDDDANSPPSRIPLKATEVATSPWYAKDASARPLLPLYSYTRTRPSQHAAAKILRSARIATSDIPACFDWLPTPPPPEGGALGT
jgi:hypothetical protein